MFRRLGVMLAVAACAAVAVGAARADTGWCGFAEGTCDTSLTYVQCSDGTVWALDQTWSASDFGEEFCGGDWVVLTAPAYSELATTDDTGSSGQLSLASNMAPDPVAYVTEIQCPNGQIWAVASGDDFVCPAA